jgi:hypothetical protein
LLHALLVGLHEVWILLAIVALFKVFEHSFDPDVFHIGLVVQNFLDLLDALLDVEHLDVGFELAMLIVQQRVI